MGLQKKQGGGNYVRFKNGAFFLAAELKEKGIEKADSYDTLEGTLVNIGLREDNFEGNIIEKLSLQIESENELFTLQFSFDSVYGSNLISFLKSADLSKPIGLKAVSKKEVRSDGEPYTKVGILVFQRDETGKEVYLKSFYTKANPNGMPEMKQVTVSGKKLWDKTDKLAFERNVILNEIQPTLSKATVNTSKPTAVFANSSEEEDDDLPF